jgi:LEA14-like dessication related protein
MKKIIPAFLALLSLLVLGISSCQSIGALLQEPKVSLGSVDLSQINFNGVDLIARLNVENPNAFDIPFPEVDWEFFINSASFVNGTVTNDTRLRANRSVTVDVPFSVSYAGLYNSFTSLLNTPEAPYRVALGVRFPIPLLDTKTFNLDYNGNIPMLQIPKIQPGSFSIAKVDFTGVEMDLGFIVDNPNSFPIPFPNVNWDYSVNGRSLVRSSLNENRNISAQSQSPANVKLNILYADVIGLLGALGTRTELPSAMKLDASFAIPALENLTSSLEIPGTLPLFR